jgi:pimeloyl-ACP methyl ester carboxylesterase
MPFVHVRGSPSLLGTNSVRIHYREIGDGLPLVLLHGGWGYEAYPFDKQIDKFADHFKILIPDRSGYGRSERIPEKLPINFHQHAAVEMMNFLEAVNIKRATLWGHSDGAVIAAMMALKAPEKFWGLILEAFHFYRAKKSSRNFFATTSSNPERLVKEMCRKVSMSQYREEYWRRIIRSHAKVWLKIVDESTGPGDNFYQGRLGQLAVPTLFLHGSDDPRTEPGEIAAVRAALPQVPIHVLDGARHSPHSEGDSYRAANRLAQTFFQSMLTNRGLPLS